MKTQKQQLLIEQTDKKLVAYKALSGVVPPSQGWLYSIRTSLKMSLRQLGKRLNISPQSVKEMEERERNESITLKSLREAATALDMQLVYGFIPKEESLENMIEKQAVALAKNIVARTSVSMELEDQENSKERIEKAIKNKSEELKLKMPNYLWD